jgi:flagella basal body P-ring formation protein FlgA
MTCIRAFLVAVAFAALPLQVRAADNPSELPTLRADVTVSSEIVRIGDVLENAGPAASIAIYRAPDPGTTGSLPVAAVLGALRQHHVIGVETNGLRDISVTRIGRSLPATDVEAAIAQALAQRMGVPDATSLAVTYDRDVQPLNLDINYAGQPSIVASRVDGRGRFDVTLEIGNESGAPMRLRYTGSAIDTVEAAVLVRALDRGETIKASDVSIERRPRSEAGADAATRDRTVGMQARRALRAGVPLRTADLAKPDLVVRDQNVTLIYQTAGIYLTGRGKAMENGTEGDVVSVMNPISKRTVTGTVTGRNQVTIATVSSQPPATLSSATPPSPVAVASAAPATR